MKLFGLFNVCLVLFSSISYGDTFKDFKSTQSSSLIVSDFFINQQWNSYEPILTKKFYSKSKPLKISSFKESSIKSVGPKVRIIPPKKIVNEDLIPNPSDEEVVIDFFEKKIGFNVPYELVQAEFYPQTHKGIENYFSIALSTQHSFLVNNIKTVSKDMKLNDWGIYLLVTKLSRKIYENIDNAKLFTWFIFNKLGYGVRVGTVRNHIAILFKSDNIIYDSISYKINSSNYYVLDSTTKPSLVYTYTNEYPDANKSINFALEEIPVLVQNIDEKEIKFVESGKEYIVKYVYNKNLIDFMATYPNVDSNIFFKAPLDNISYMSVSKSIKEFIDRKKASYAINFILHFVQKGFKYKRDLEQFEKQKTMFAQETLYYDSSDSEDRVILFAKLIKNFFGFKVIGVKYDDHISTAIYIPLKGDSVKLSSRRYVIADPTYPNANLGKNISKYKDLKPKEFIIIKD